MKSKAISQSSCTNRLDISICARLSKRLSRRFGCLISLARPKSSSREPYSLISKAAVLIPMPGAPGTLSTLSPAKACTSTTRSGYTPNFSTTPSRSIILFFIASSMTTPPPINCIISLSELMMVQLPPASRARQARVAMMSSASKPSTSLHATLKARVASRVKGNWGIKSSGVGGRLALYLSYISLRKVLPEWSKITATCVGASGPVLLST